MLDIIPLIGLALVDSLSVGTLVIPLTLLLRWGKLRTIPYATYLGTITVAYFALGITLMLGFAGIGPIITEATQTDWFPWVTLVLGAALAVFGIFAPNPKKPEPGETNVPTDTTKMQKATRAGLAGMVSRRSDRGSHDASVPRSDWHHAVVRDHPAAAARFVGGVLHHHGTAGDARERCHGPGRRPTGRSPAAMDSATELRGEGDAAMDCRDRRHHHGLSQRQCAQPLVASDRALQKTTSTPALPSAQGLLRQDPRRPRQPE